MLQGCSTFSREKEFRNLLPVPLPPSSMKSPSTDREIELPVTVCKRYCTHGKSKLFVFFQKKWTFFRAIQGLSEGLLFQTSPTRPQKVRTLALWVFLAFCHTWSQKLSMVASFIFVVLENASASLKLRPFLIDDKVGCFFKVFIPWSRLEVALRALRICIRHG